MVLKIFIFMIIMFFGLLLFKIMSRLCDFLIFLLNNLFDRISFNRSCKKHDVDLYSYLELGSNEGDKNDK